MNPAPLATKIEARPTLPGAIASLLSTLGLVLALFLVVGQHAWSDAPAHGPEISGTYVATASSDPDLVGAVEFATATFGMRFIDADRVEVCIDRKIFDAYYRVENDRVLIEAVDPPTIEKVWIFDIQDNRLVSRDTVLKRMPE